MVASALLLAAASPAAAHAELTETEPGGGAALARAPRQILLRFTESVEVSFGSIRVFDEDGERLTTGRARHPDGRPSTVALELPVLAKGAYVVTWRVLSADSHPVRGAFTFRVGPAPPGGDDSQALAERLLNAEGGSTSVGAAYGAVRFAVFASLLLLVGGTGFILLLWPAGFSRPRVRGMIGGAWVVSLVGTTLGIGLQGAYAGGLTLADALKPSVFSAVLDTRFGRIWTARLVLLVLAGLLLWHLSRRGDSDEEASAAPAGDARGKGQDPSPAGLAQPAAGALPTGRSQPAGEHETIGEPGPVTSARAAGAKKLVGGPVLVLGAVVAVALLATPGLAGHAGAGSLVPLAVAADVVHLGAVSLWLAGLAIVVAVLLPTADVDTTGQVVRRFSRVALVAVVAILATGTLQGWRQVGSIDALTTTTYGRLLLVKVALFALMVGLAAASRSWVRRRYRSPQLAASPAAGAAASGEPALSPAAAAVSEGLTARGRSAAGGSGANTAEGPVVAVSRLRRSVLAEMGVAAAILAVTALLVNAVPAKTALAKPFSVELVARGLLVEVTVDPAKAGRLDLHLYTLTPAGAVKDVEELTASLSLPAKDVAPIAAPLRRAGPGHFAAYGFDVPIVGRWRLEVAARLTEVDVVTATATVPIR